MIENKLKYSLYTVYGVQCSTVTVLAVVLSTLHMKPIVWNSTTSIVVPILELYRAHKGCCNSHELPSF